MRLQLHTKAAANPENTAPNKKQHRIEDVTKNHESAGDTEQPADNGSRILSYTKNLVSQKRAGLRCCPQGAYSFLYSFATIIVVVRKMSDSDLSLSVKNLSRSARSLTYTFAMASYSPYSSST